MDKNSLQLPQKTIWIMVLGFLLLVSMGLGTFFAVNPKIKSLDAKITLDTHRLDVMKELYPSYTRLHKVYQVQSDLKTILYDAAPQSVEDITGFGPIVASLCKESGMQFISATPLPESIRGGEHKILVEAVIRGEFRIFRDFLVKLLQVQSLISAQQIQSRSIVDNREYSLKLWVRLQ